MNLSTPAHAPSRFGIAVSRDGALLATVGPENAERTERIVRLRDARTGAHVADLGRHTAAIAHAVFGPDGIRLATTGVDGVRIWDLEARALIAHFPAMDGGFECAAFDPRGERLAVGTLGGNIRIWDVRSGERVGLIEAVGAWAIRSVAFTADGRGVMFSNWWSLMTADAVDRARPRELAVSSTMVSHTQSNWANLSGSQVHSYGGSAPGITFGTSMGNNTDAATYTASASYGFSASTQTVSGAAVLRYSSTNMGTTVAGGTNNTQALLYSIGNFGASRQVQSGDTLNVTLTVSFA